ncbi:MAG: ABC transporter ATP-binding protein [Geobacter sp.]|nr:ABC transporter ATP-binding protein [Geobacter sp.]
MTAPSLQIEKLGKAFRRYNGEWRRVLSWFGFPVTPSDEHWVLRDISFGVAPGEAVGIVGQNGAGKSTLLKLITGTLRATEGSCTVSGRIAAILELGMGFNPEFTGRQNVFHAAGLMGFQVSEIQAVMPEIEEFAEIGDYFNQPVRTYSSGMQMRVAFSVATAFRPDILIVDEALSVGDAYFQHKSFDRIRDYQKQGTTLLIVSHDKAAVQSLCNRAILIDKGRQVIDGKPEEVMDYYNALIAEKENSTIRIINHDNGKRQTVSGTGQASVITVGLYNNRGEQIEIAQVGEQVELRILVHVKEALPRLVLGYLIKDRLGQSIFGTNSQLLNQPLECIRGGAFLEYKIDFTMALGPGSYSVTTALTATETHLTENYEWRDLALVFTVANINKPLFDGVAWLPPTVAVEYCENKAH